jgi:hypothetical protein
MQTRSTRLGLTALMAAAVMGLAGADDATQTIKAGELTFKAPAAWKKERPKSSMRQAQLRVEPVEGDKEPAELVLFAFPNGAGTVEANIERWESQFVGADGVTPKAKVEKKKGTNVEVTRVEIAGRFVAAVSPGAAEKNNKPAQRLLGAIVQTPQAGYFFKMVGPDKTMTAARPAFDAMIATISKSDD